MTTSTLKSLALATLVGLFTSLAFGVDTSKFPAIKVDKNLDRGYATISGTTPTLDADYGVTLLTTSGNTTVTIVNVPTTVGRSFYLQLTSNGTNTLSFAGVTITPLTGTFVNPPANGITRYKFTVVGPTLYLDVIAPLTAAEITALIGVSTTINPTDNYIPVRTSATTFGDSPIYVLSDGTHQGLQFIEPILAATSFAFTADSPLSIGSDGAVITPAVSNIPLYNPVATNRTFTVSNGYGGSGKNDGMILLLRWTGTNTATLANTGNALLSSDWNARADGDLIQLIWDGDNSKWREQWRYPSAGTTINSYLATDATTTSATMANLSLSATVISGKKYGFNLILYANDSLAADGAKIDFDGGTATATNFRAQCTAFDTTLVLSSQSSALATDFTVATFTGDGSFEIHGSIEPSATGTLVPRFAQNSHTTGTLTVYRGSHLLLWEIAN